MNRTTTKPSQFDALNVLYGHEMALKNCIPAEKGTINGNFFPAGSEMKSSANDMANLMIMLLNEGQFQGQAFLKATSVEEIFKSNISFQGLGTMLGGNGIDIHCGLSWLKMEIEERTIFIQVGNTGTTAAIAGLSRDQNQGVIMIFNGDVNRLDRYVYPTLENTVNNVIHLLNGEATTDFAVMRFDDPYEDEDYVLPKEKWSKYIGKYFPYGKESPFFKDITIDIYEDENGQLALKSFNEKVLKGHYLLQFTNESRAALRNISQPREIQFTIFPNGAIGGLFMFGTSFKKRDVTLAAKFKPVKINQAEKTLSFSFPKSAKYNWDGTLFKATFPDKKETAFQLQLNELSATSFEAFTNQIFDNQTISTKGNLLTKNLRGGIWTEQSIFTNVNGKYQQHLLIFYQNAVAKLQMQGVLTSPYGQFTLDMQEVVMYLQRSVSF